MKKEKVSLEISKLKENSFQEEDPQLIADLARLVVKDLSVSLGDVEIVHDRLSEERDRILDLLQEDGLALHAQAEIFRADEGCVLVAANQNIHALKFASKELLGDVAFGRQIIDSNPSGFQYLAEEVKNTLMGDPEYALKIIKTNPVSAELLSPSLRKNKQFVLEILAYSPLTFTLLNYELRDDAEVAIKALTAVIQDSEKKQIIESMSPRLRELVSQLKHY